MSGWHPASPHDWESTKYSEGKNFAPTDWAEEGKNGPFGPSPSPLALSGAQRGFSIDLPGTGSAATAVRITLHPAWITTGNGRATGSNRRSYAARPASARSRVPSLVLAR